MGPNKLKDIKSIKNGLKLDKEEKKIRSRSTKLDQPVKKLNKIEPLLA